MPEYNNIYLIYSEVLLGYVSRCIKTCKAEVRNSPWIPMWWGYQATAKKYVILRLLK